MGFEIIRKLYHYEEDCGLEENVIAKACKRWKVLPSTLLAYYRQLGGYQALNHAQNDLCAPDKLINAGDYLIFYVENQYVVQWALKKEDLVLDDPPVYSSLDEMNFQVACESLTGFFNWMAHFHAVFALPYDGEEIYMVTEDKAAEIRKHYRKKPFKLRDWLNVNFYGNYEDEVIYLGENDDYDMMYACYGEEQFQRLKQFMDGLHLESY